jgi:DNA-binding protein Fis
VSHSVKLIVAAYVSLKDRQAIEDLREHRQVLRKKLQDINGMDVSSSLQLIESDLSEIEAGLTRLQ